MRGKGGGRKGRSGPPGNRNAERHGLATLQRAIIKLGNRGLDFLDGRTRVAKALAERQSEILDDQGGEAAVATARRILVREASVSELILMSINVVLLEKIDSGESLLDDDGKVLTVVMERRMLADSLTKQLATIGLERAAKPIQSLDQYIRENYPRKVENAHHDGDGDHHDDGDGAAPTRTQRSQGGDS